MELSASIQAQLRAIEEEAARQKKAVLESQLGPLKDELRKVESQIHELENKADYLRAQIAEITGTAAGRSKSASKGKGSRRPMLRMDQKLALVAGILKDEGVLNAAEFPVKAVAKRLEHEAHLTPADLSATNLHKFLPPGIKVVGTGREKKFVKG